MTQKSYIQVFTKKHLGLAAVIASGEGPRQLSFDLTRASSRSQTNLEEIPYLLWVLAIHYQ